MRLGAHETENFHNKHGWAEENAHTLMASGHQTRFFGKHLDWFSRSCRFIKRLTDVDHLIFSKNTVGDLMALL